METIKILSVKVWSTGLLSLVLASLLGLTACGGGDNDDAGAREGELSTITISGKTLASGGQVALFEQRPIMLSVMDFLMPPASAIINGLSPITGALVELIRIDNNGVQVGAVLASTYTSITGDYNLALPQGVSLAGNLVVRVTGIGAVTQSAMVVSQAVNITPVSEFILQRFIAAGTELHLLPPEEVVALTGRIDEFDMTAAPGANLYMMLTQLEAEVGLFVTNQIVGINSPPGDAATAAAAVGAWNTVKFGLEMHDSHPNSIGSFDVGSRIETVTLSDHGNGNISIDDGAVEKATTHYNVDQSGNTSIYFGSDIGQDDGETFPASIFPNGSLMFDTPFREGLDTVDLIANPGGPNFGWRTPAATGIAIDTGNGNVKLMVSREGKVRYETVDSSGDGVKDALDPNVLSGHEASLDLMIALKQGSGMSNASLSGDYGFVSLGTKMSKAPVYRDVDTLAGTLQFDGVGTVNVHGSNVPNKRTVVRTPAAGQPGSAALTATHTISSQNLATMGYNVTPEGRIILDEDPSYQGNDIVEGYVSDDGGLIVTVDAENTYDDPVTPTEILDSNQKITVATKVGTNPVNVSGLYTLYPLIVGFEDNGATTLKSYRPDSQLAISPILQGGYNLMIETHDLGFKRANDNADIDPLIPADTLRNYTVTTGLNGAITMTFTNSVDEITLDGFVSADTKIMVLRSHQQKVGNPGSEQTLGIVLAIKQ